MICNIIKMAIALAYSGGLDTSCILHWLINEFKEDVYCIYVDVGQIEDKSEIKKRAIKIGARECIIVDARREFVYDYIFKAVRANAIYENKYLLGTAIARPLIAKKVVEYARKFKCDKIAHGATGKGNDQVRFEITFKVLAPQLEVIAPWRVWDIKGRLDAINYAKKYNLPVKHTREKPYSSDENLWHISYEGGILEDIDSPPPEDIFKLTLPPEKAKTCRIKIEFENGVPVKLNGRKMDGVKLIEKLNFVAGGAGIGRVDIVEDRFIGIKSRGVYEAPAATVIYRAKNEIEEITLERDLRNFMAGLSNKYAELVYNGFWFSGLKEALDGFFERVSRYINGSVEVELKKGVMKTISRKSNNSVYDVKLATFEESDFSHKDAEGFIKLAGLQISAFRAKNPPVE